MKTIKVSKEVMDELMTGHEEGNLVITNRHDSIWIECQECSDVILEIREEDHDNQLS